MHRRNLVKSRGVDPPARFEEDASVELGSGRGKNHSLVSKNKYSNPKVSQNFRRHPIVETTKLKLRSMVNDFCHARTGTQGCFVAGVVRCSYAVLYMYSLIQLTIQMPTLLDPHKGLLPYFITGEDVGDWDYSIFEFFPQSSFIMYLMFLLGWVSGVFLLLGIEPRKAAIGAYFFLYNLQNHSNEALFDHEMRMSKMWAFFLILLPLDHFTVYDDFGGLASVMRKRQSIRSRQQLRSQTWPMWPFRLWQVYTCMVCMGAGFGKLNSEEWRSGNAMSWTWYDETIGRWYPAFVVELLYNRLICIKLQTWHCLFVQNLAFITIWPLKTRKMTFTAVLLLHIRMELALVKHIFEYLSVLGWVCFFVYPNDGKSNAEGLIKNKKSDGDKWATGIAFSSRKAKTIEIAVAVSLLCLLVYDIFPREEVEQLMPTPLAYLVRSFLYPPQFVSSALFVLNHSIGIGSGPFVLFKGKPWHAQTRMTAVIRFSDGEEPILHQDSEWKTSSLFQREIDYWYDTYTDFLYEDLGEIDDVPYYAALSVYLAETYGKGSIDRHYDKVTIVPENEIESVSIQVHRREGSDLPAPQDWSLFSSIPRQWRYQSVCQFVFTPQVVQLDDRQFTMPLNILWGHSGDASRHIQNGCINYNTADDVYHREGKYGDFYMPADITVDTDDDYSDEDGEAAVAGPYRTDDNEEGGGSGVYNRGPPIANDDENDEDDDKNPNDGNDDGIIPEGQVDEEEQEDPDDEGNGAINEGGFFHLAENEEEEDSSQDIDAQNRRRLLRSSQLLN